MNLPSTAPRNSNRPSFPSLASSAGQPFAEVNIANDRETMLTFYYTRGFPKVTFNASWRTVKPGHVSVVYDIVEGDREYVRDVLTSGLKTTRQSLVDRAITLKAGDPLSPTAQTNIQQALYNLGVFANVDTAIENPDGDTDHKYVLYHFDEANRYTFSIGLGLQLAQFGVPNSTSLAAPGGTTGVSPEGSLTVSRLNFLGLGHTVSLQGVYSSIQKRALAHLFATETVRRGGAELDLHPALRRHAGRANLCGAARGSVRAALQEIFEIVHRRFSGCLPAGQRERHCHPGSAGFAVPAVRPARDTFGQLRSGPAR